MRLEAVRTPLGNAEAMIHLIPSSIAAVLGLLEHPREPGLNLANARALRLPDCACGLNPYVPYFVAGEQAIVEEMVLLEYELPATERDEYDVAEVVHAIGALARAEIETFCGVCIRRAWNCSPSAMRTGRPLVAAQMHRQERATSPALRRPAPAAGQPAATSSDSAW